MPDGDLLAHSLAEAYLYVMVTACPACGKGPLLSSEATLVDSGKRMQTAGLRATCRACDASSDWQFQIRPAQPDAPHDAVNPSDEPSRLIDLAQWITLSRMITEAAGRSDDRIQARGFRIQAWQCLDEALKFFDPDNALPPATAFFGAESKARFREHPEQFARSRLLQLRERLPTRSATQPNGDRQR